MRFSILAVIVALVASVSASDSGCSGLNGGCKECEYGLELANGPLKSSCSRSYWHIATRVAGLRWHAKLHALLFLVLADDSTDEHIDSASFLCQPTCSPCIHLPSLVKSTHHNSPTVRDESFTRPQMNNGTSSIRRHKGRCESRPCQEFRDLKGLGTTKKGHKKKTAKTPAQIEPKQVLKDLEICRKSEKITRTTVTLEHVQLAIACFIPPKYESGACSTCKANDSPSIYHTYGTGSMWDYVS
ncbi:hypothetical protein F4604DRAFT_1903891 [Suillus subluteus]|nr:hypothetical protein F4604DRAFT_1903891 [Suillus subluteus]